MDFLKTTKKVVFFYILLYNIKTIVGDFMMDYYEFVKNEIYNILSKNNHIHNLNRQKIDNFYEENLNFKDIVDGIVNKIIEVKDYNYKNDLEKFDKLFSKTRFCNLPNYKMFNNLTLDTANNYNTKIINEIMNLRIFNYLDEKIILNLINAFGLFENDKYVYSRLELLIKLFRLKTVFNEDDFKLLNVNKSFFEKTIKNEYMIKEDITIPDFLNSYLKRYMYDYDLEIFNKLNDDIKNLAIDFFEHNYIIKEVPYFYMKSGTTGKVLKKIYNSILKSDVSNQVTINNINRIFGSSFKYNQNALMFIIKNFKMILENEKYQYKINDIYNNFDEIDVFFKSKGNTNFNLDVALEYVTKFNFTSNQEFLNLLKNSGAKDKKILLKYSKLYIEMKKRTISTIPKINYEYVQNINQKNYKLKIEILDYNDPFALLIGEENYINCCQRYNSAAEPCMIHAVTEGRIICIYLLDKKNNKILLANSWIWRRGNMLCFDSVEGSTIMKENRIYRDLVANAYIEASNKLLEISKQFSDNIEVICIGRGYGEFIDDLRLEHYFKQSEFNLVKPYGYDAYLDSQIIYFIKGNKNLIKPNLVENKIYTDDEKQYKKTM